MARAKRRPIAERLLANSRVVALGCFEWMGDRTGKGYGRLQIDGTKYLAHRLSYETFRGPVPKGMLVCHHCDNRSCVNPCHLFVGSNADNMADMVAKGRQNKCKGESNGRAKLDEPTVLAIRRENGATNKQIAERYGATVHQVNDIRSGRTWKHLGVTNG
jgi:hypothetical protein